MSETLALGDVANIAYIVCHIEDVSNLENALDLEGFSVRVNRQPKAQNELSVSASIKCLQNHLSIWQEVVDQEINVIVVESDFVPVVGLRKLHTPFPEAEANDTFAYLYACGIEVYDLLDGNKLRGHSGSTVAYFLNPKAAKVLISFADEILKGKNINEYSTWDTKIRHYLQSHGVNSFVPFRNFGEHGGLPNPEHASKGLNGTHRADRLAGRLHFLPAYAANSKLTYYKTRISAWLWGLGRLLLGRATTKDSIKRQPSSILFLLKLAQRLSI